MDNVKYHIELTTKAYAFGDHAINRESIELDRLQRLVEGITDIILAPGAQDFIVTFENRITRFAQVITVKKATDRSGDPSIVCITRYRLQGEKRRSTVFLTPKQLEDWMASLKDIVLTDLTEYPSNIKLYFHSNLTHSSQTVEITGVKHNG